MKLFVPLVIVLLASVVSAQTGRSTMFKINGIGLGATYNAVIAKFGKPIRVVKAKGDECVGGNTRLLKYPGLSFKLYDNGNNTNFTVGDLEVTSSKWNVSGIKIGDTSAAVRSRLGKASSTEAGGSGSRETVWYYEINETDGPGTSNVYFRGGKVSRIFALFEMC